MSSSFPQGLDEYHHGCHSILCSDRCLSIISSTAAVKKPDLLTISLLNVFQATCYTAFTDEDIVPSNLFAGASLSVLTFTSCVLFILVGALSLRWLRVMVTLKVCVCCSSILSSSDTLTKGHHANA